MRNHAANLTHPDIDAGLLSIDLVVSKKSHKKLEIH